MTEDVIGAFAAKTHFSKILEGVERGKNYIVTKRGKAVAKIIPLDSHEDDLGATLDELSRIRKSNLPLDLNIKDYVEAGRKY